VSDDGRSFVIHRAVGVAVAGAGLVLVAEIFDAAPLFVPAVALVIIGVLAPVWVWLCARGADARRALSAERVIEDEPLAARLQIRRGWLGLPGAEVIDPFTRSRLALSGPLSPIRDGRTATVRVVARFPRRGLLALEAPALVISDPLDLARVRTTRCVPAQRLLVLPRTEPVRWLTVAGGGRLPRPDGDASAEAQAAVDIDGLRPYRPGTPASRIHWPTVARGGELIERRLRADGDSRPLVVLDARGVDGPDGDAALDDAVRACASLALDLARHGGCGLLLPGEQRPTAIDRELGAWAAAYARLAVVHGRPGGRPSPAPRLGPLGGRRGAVLYVAAAPSARVAGALTACGAALLMLVVPRRVLVEGRPPGARGRMSATLEVSGCRGFALGARRAPPAPSPEARVASG